jgi:hypothetical protein
MKHATDRHTDKSFRIESTGNSKRRFPDLHNLPKPRWRDALAALAAPAIRMHQYRNLHKSMFYDAICQMDDCEAGR